MYVIRGAAPGVQEAWAQPVEVCKSSCAPNKPTPARGSSREPRPRLALPEYETYDRAMRLGRCRRRRRMCRLRA